MCVACVGAYACAVGVGELGRDPGGASDGEGGGHAGLTIDAWGRGQTTMASARCDGGAEPTLTGLRRQRGGGCTRARVLFIDSRTGLGHTQCRAMSSLGSIGGVGPLRLACAQPQASPHECGVCLMCLVARAVDPRARRCSGGARCAASIGFAGRAPPIYWGPWCGLR